MPTLREALSALEGSYQSIDLRAILVSLGDAVGWRGVFCVIRLSSLPPEAVAARHQGTMDAYHVDPVHRNRYLSESEPGFVGMNLELAALPISALEDVFSRWCQGVVKGNRAFRFTDWQGERPDVMDADMSSMWAGTGDGEPWRGYQWGVGSMRTNFSSDPASTGTHVQTGERDFDGWARDAGFADFRRIALTVLGAPFGQGDALQLRAPVYARVRDMVQSGTVLKVDGDAHAGLGPLDLEAELYVNDGREYYLQTPIPLGRRTIPPAGDTLAPFSVTFDLGRRVDAGRVEFSLFKLTPRRVDLGESRLTLTNGSPHFQAYVAFVDEAHVSEYFDFLVKGWEPKGSQLGKRFTRRDPADMLEFVTMHLLGLSQMDPVLLSEPRYDVIGGGVQAGSADILARGPDGKPILVSCTTGMPKDPKRGMLVAARQTIAQRIGRPTDDLDIVLVTSKPGSTESQNRGLPGVLGHVNEVFIPDEQAEMLIINANGLLQIWKDLQQGDIAGARRRFGIH